MVQTAVMIEQFPQTLKKYSNRVNDERLESLAEGIDKVRSLNPAVYDEKNVARYLQERARTLRGLVDEYLFASIAQRFPLISDDLFGLKRYLTLTGQGKTWEVVSDNTEVEEFGVKEGKEQKKKVKTVEIPLFAYTPLFDGKHTAKLGSFSITKTRDFYTRRTTVTIEAKLPGDIGPNLKNTYRDALSHYLGVLSKMFTNSVAGDIMYADGNIAHPEIGALWIPTPESLSVNVSQKLIRKKRVIDPAMILKVRGKNFLVKTWKVDDEEPLERYLREFSVGDSLGDLEGKI